MEDFKDFLAKQAARYKKTAESWNKYFGDNRSRRLHPGWIKSSLDAAKKNQSDFLKDDQEAHVKFEKFKKNNYSTIVRFKIIDFFEKCVTALEKDLASLEQGARATSSFYEIPLEIEASGFLDPGLDDTYEKIDADLFEKTMNEKQMDYFPEVDVNAEKVNKIKVPVTATEFERKFYGKANTLYTFGNMLVDSINNGMTIILEEEGADFCDSTLDELKENYKRVDNLYAEIIQMVLEAVDAPNEIQNHEIMSFAYLNRLKKAKHDAEVRINMVKKNRNLEIKNFTAPKHEYGHIKIPEIKIDKFKGDLDRYLSFKDAVSKMIAMYPDISDDIKLRLLSQNLLEKPLICIKSARTYERAWELLDASFGRKRNIARVYLDRIFNFSSILDMNDCESLKTFEFTLEESLEGLKALKCPPDEFILWSIMQKLPLVLQDRFNELHSSKDFHSVSDLLEFLKDYTVVLDSREMRNELPIFKKAYPKSNSQSIVGSNNSFKKNERPKRICLYCNENSHWSLSYCQMFKSKKPEERLQFIKDRKLCFRCLNDHSIRDCKNNDSCSVCLSKFHNTLLHVEGKKNLNKNKSSGQNSLIVNESQECKAQNAQNNVSINLAVSDLDKEINVLSTLLNSKYVLQASAEIHVRAKDGSSKVMRSILDNGSQVNFITEEAAQTLRLPIKNTEVRQINGILCSTNDVRRSVSLKFSSVHNKNYVVEITAFVVKRLINQLPSKEFSVEHLECAKNILLADKNFNIPNNVDILLSAEISAQVVRNQLFKDPSGKLVFQSSELGYLVYGALGTDSDNIWSNSVNLTIEKIDDLPKEKQIKKILEVDESIGVDQSFEKNDENIIVENHFMSTVQRDKYGNVIVSIPLVKDISLLGDSKRKALGCFLRIEDKFKVDVDFYSEYKKFMQNYLDLHHMELVNWNDKNLNFLTHHAVIRTNAVTTKLRVVFNASAKTTSGYSFNDLQPVGPKLQADIWEILLNWRFYSHVFTADIQNMFRTILINEKDRNLHAIIWRNSANESLKAYRLTTVTYGTKIAPYLAKRTLQFIAEQEREKVEKDVNLLSEERLLRLEAVNILINLVYMDDIYGGGYNATHLKRIKNIVIEILNGANMKLHKFASNCLEALSDLDTNKLYNGQLNFDDDYVKTLGVLYCPKGDSFGFKVKNASLEVTSITKRKMLSHLCEIFDPLGFLAPVNLKLKLLWQDVVETGIKWDENVNDVHLTSYNKIVSEMHMLEKISIPRWIEYMPSSLVEIHGFCDASKRAYGAVLYLKIFTGNTFKIKFLRAKTHIFKLECNSKEVDSNNLTNPRKELCAALLLAELIETTKEALKKINLTPSNVFAYSDNQVVLYWIHNKHVTYPVFIQNRVKKIRKLHNFWCFIGTKVNPADLASRGLPPSKIVINDLWWSPSFLMNTIQPERFIPTEEKLVDNKSSVLAIPATTLQKNSLIFEFVRKFSSYKRLVRRTVYLQKFIAFIVKKKIEKTISPEDFDKAELALFRLDQKTSFFKDYKTLSDGFKISNNSKIKNLCPFIDKNGVIRVKGRLRNANLSQDEMQPIILDHNGFLAYLIMENAHFMCLHGAKSLTVAISRTKFWITRGADVARRVISRCVKCIRFGAKTINQQMGDLPEARVLEARPFAKTGVDYAGPFTIKSMVARGKRMHKAYACVFVCMVTKAVHIELVSDLSAERFLMSYERFVARRGNCSEIYSDNGSNFVLGKKLLDKDCRLAIQEGSDLLKNLIGEQKTKWRNIPPLSPHHGGLWEASVKSMKYHLNRIMGNTVLTFEELNTFLTKIEACLNSRPLAALTNDPNSFILTPGHFLIGEQLLAPPKPLQKQLIHLKGDKLINRKVEEAWMAWRQDVLKSMMVRKKWQNVDDNIMIGDVVLLKDEQTPPTVWPLARVSNTHPGKDDKIRVVTVKTGNKEYTRPISKIVPLVKKQFLNEIEDSNNHAVVTRSKSKLKNVFNTNLIFQLLIMLLLLPAAFSSPYNITKFDKNQHVIIEKVNDVRIANGEWNIFTFIELSAYVNAKNHMNDLFIEAKYSCDLIKQKYGDNSCSNVILDFSGRLQAFEGVEGLIEDYHVRKRRQATEITSFGIGFGLGMLVDSFFHASNDELDSKIMTLARNQEKLIALQKNNTSLLENTINFINENEKAINKEIKLLAKQFYEVGEHVKHNEYYVQFFKFSIQFMTNFDEIKIRQKTIIDLMYSKNHKMDPIIITFDSFKKEIENIGFQKFLNMNVNLKDLYNNAEISARTTKKMIIFKIKIPLLANEKYEMLKIIPIPFRTKTGKFYKLSLNFDKIIIDNITNNYIIDKDFKQCYYISKLLICDILHLRKNPSCESMLSKGVITEDCKLVECKKEHNEFVRLTASNKWIFHIVNKTRIQINCSSAFFDLMFEPQVGQLVFQDDCLLFDGDWTIFAYQVLNMTMDNVFIPSFNTTWVEEFPVLNFTIDIAQPIKDLRFLARQLEEEKLITFEKIISHPYTQTLVCIGILIILILIIFSLMYYRYIHHVRQKEKAVDISDVIKRMDLVEQQI